MYSLCRGCCGCSASAPQLGSQHYASEGRFSGSSFDRIRTVSFDAGAEDLTVTPNKLYLSGSYKWVAHSASFMQGSTGASLLFSNRPWRQSFHYTKPSTVFSDPTNQSRSSDRGATLLDFSSDDITQMFRITRYDHDQRWQCALGCSVWVDSIRRLCSSFWSHGVDYYWIPIW